jgi:hypothetical protein
MKNAICIVAVVISLELVAGSALATTKVYLLAGQSNMGGAGGPAYGEPALPAPYNAVQTSVHILGRADDQTWNTWQNLQIGFGQVPNSLGPEVTFGYTLHNTIFPNDSIYLVKYGVGGTRLSSAANEWNTSINGGAGGALYQSFKSTVNSAMANLTTAGKSPTIAGLIWMQGESDTGSADAAAYATNLTNFIHKVRSDFALPNMPVVIGRITTHYGTAANSAVVRTAEMTVPGQVGHASWINTDDLEQNPTAPWHYGTQGQIDLGIRFANGIAALTVPEPSTLVLAGTGLLACAAYWWRKQAGKGLTDRFYPNGPKGVFGED